MTADVSFVAGHSLSRPPPRRKPPIPSPYGQATMASSALSPGYLSQQPNFGSGSSSQDMSPLPSMNLGVLTALNEKRARDGQPPKRRGPKPDSKPALTRRQELNRQAQRTHRERKELYIKALEDEVLRLKEIFSTAAQDKQRLAEENKQLRALLAQSGLGVAPMTSTSSVPDDSLSNLSSGYTSSGSMSGSYAPPASSNASTFTPPPLSAGTAGPRGGCGISPHSTISPPKHVRQPSMGAGPGRPPDRNPKLDYEQAGIDFVLALEKPCMNHMPWLLERNLVTGNNEPCGHALMASCPPEPFSDLTPDIPFGHTHTHIRTHSHSNSNDTTRNPLGHNQGQQQQRTWELSKADLGTLLDLSRRLNLDGEITPVMAWGMVLAHPRLEELREGDFVRVAEELRGKVRCYGFGAVMEDFEVRDALESVFSTKTELGLGY